ncbi:MAG TPA: hypothetical protein DHW82_05395 [Spirochaetia bacterium]|nr:hypothetical protein [Spirochaetia bacterium]
MREPQIILQNGGFLFQIALNQSEFYFSFLPFITEGNRNHHYDIKIKKNQQQVVFNGCINTDQTITLVPSLSKEDLKDFPESKKTALIQNYKIIADFFTLLNFTEAFELDFCSIHIFTELKLLKTVPETMNFYQLKNIE